MQSHQKGDDPASFPRREREEHSCRRHVDIRYSGVRLWVCSNTAVTVTMASGNPLVGGIGRRRTLSLCEFLLPSERGLFVPVMTPHHFARAHVQLEHSRGDPCRFPIWKYQAA